MVLGRNGKQRWHLIKTMTTQLLQHERIYTTKAKANCLQRYGQRVMKHAKRSADGISAGTNMVKKLTTTELAQKKAVLELAVRFKQQDSNFTRISKTLYRRRGDNAQVVYIEYKGNEYEKYEKTKKDEQSRILKNTNVKRFKHKFLNQQREFLQKRLDDPNTKDTEILKSKIEQVCQDIDVLNKQPKSPFLYRYLV